MTKDEFDSMFRDYVRNNLSPTKGDQEFVSRIHSSFEKILTPNCLLVGSYKRYTAIRPLHDLDILYVIGKWQPNAHNPRETLAKLESQINQEYENPTSFHLKVVLQTHSITVVYTDSSAKEVFSVDIVPAYVFGKNNFDLDMYMVPELYYTKHRGRARLYEDLQKERREMLWIPSDPSGYIEIAKELNELNTDFRKTVKFIKAWKNSLKEKDETIKFKSFHIEQVVTQYFQSIKNIEIFDAIFKFFCEIPNIIEKPQIPDRADKNKMIDDYLDKLPVAKKDFIIQARDCFLIKLEEFSETSSISDLLKACFYKRHSLSEKFIFDFGIPTLIDNELEFRIDGFVKRKNGFRDYNYKVSNGFGNIDTNNFIKFRILRDGTSADLYKWKVKNDNSCEEPRGEITDHHTKSYPESTKYIGNHYVECYPIKDNVCIAKSRQDVVIVHGSKFR